MTGSEDHESQSHLWTDSFSSPLLHPSNNIHSLLFYVNVRGKERKEILRDLIRECTCSTKSHRVKQRERRREKKRSALVNGAKAMLSFLPVSSWISSSPSPPDRVTHRDVVWRMERDSEKKKERTKKPKLRREKSFFFAFLSLFSAGQIISCK